MAIGDYDAEMAKNRKMKQSNDAAWLKAAKAKSDRLKNKKQQQVESSLKGNDDITGDTNYSIPVVSKQPPAFTDDETDNLYNQMASDTSSRLADIEARKRVEDDIREDRILTASNAIKSNNESYTDDPQGASSSYRKDPDDSKEEEYANTVLSLKANEDKPEYDDKGNKIDNPDIDSDNITPKSSKPSFFERLGKRSKTGADATIADSMAPKKYMSYNGRKAPGNNRKTSEVDKARLSTVANLGSKMTARLKKNTMKVVYSYPLYDESGKTETTITPISKSTLKMYEELGIGTVYGIPKEGDGMDYDSVDYSSMHMGPVKNPKGSKHAAKWARGPVVVNPPFQLNENDDVRSNPYFPNVGRIYGDEIRENFPIVVFEVGKVTYQKGFMRQLGNYIEGDGQAIASNEYIKGKRGFLGTAGNVIKSLVTNTIGVIAAPFNALMKRDTVSKFVQDTHLFSKYFDEMINTLGAMYGIVDLLDDKEANAKNDPDKDTIDDELINKMSKEDYDKYMKEKKDTADKDRAVQLKNVMERQNNDENSQFNNFLGKGSGKIWSEAKDYGGYMSPAKNIGAKTKGRYPNAINYSTVVPGGDSLTTIDYIPFLVYSNSSVSESISNQVDTNPFSASMNSNAEETEKKKHGSADDMSKEGIQDKVAGMINKFKKTLWSAGNGDNLVVLSGDGRMNLPDVWTNSSFNRSYSMQFKFESPYGDDLSVFENVVVPFALLLIMATPRQIGKVSYTSPFMVRVHSKGWFSIPMGIIESMSITRSRVKNSVTASGHSRSIEVSLTIKDLSPMMMLGLNMGSFSKPYNANVGFQQYLSTIGALSISDTKSIKARMSLFFKTIRGKFNNMFGKNINILEQFAFKHGSAAPIRTFVEMRKMFGAGSTSTKYY